MNECDAEASRRCVKNLCSVGRVKSVHVIGTCDLDCTIVAVKGGGFVGQKLNAQALFQSQTKVMVVVISQDCKNPIRRVYGTDQLLHGGHDLFIRAIIGGSEITGHRT